MPTTPGGYGVMGEQLRPVEANTVAEVVQGAQNILETPDYWYGSEITQVLMALQATPANVLPAGQRDGLIRSLTRILNERKQETQRIDTDRNDANILSQAQRPNVINAASSSGGGMMPTVLLLAGGAVVLLLLLKR